MSSGAGCVRVFTRSARSQPPLSRPAGGTHPARAPSRRARDPAPPPPRPPAAPAADLGHPAGAGGDHRHAGRRAVARGGAHGADRLDQPAQPHRAPARRPLRLGVLGRDPMAVLAGRRAGRARARLGRAPSRLGPRRARVRRRARAGHPGHGGRDRGGRRGRVAAPLPHLRRRRRAELRAGRARRGPGAHGSGCPRTPPARGRPARRARPRRGGRSELRRRRPPARRPRGPGPGRRLAAAPRW